MVRHDQTFRNARSVYPFGPEQFLPLLDTYIQVRETMAIGKLHRMHNTHAYAYIPNEHGSLSHFIFFIIKIIIIKERTDSKFKMDQIYIHIRAYLSNILNEFLNERSLKTEKYCANYIRRYDLRAVNLNLISRTHVQQYFADFRTNLSVEKIFQIFQFRCVVILYKQNLTKSLHRVCKINRIFSIKKKIIKSNLCNGVDIFQILLISAVRIDFFFVVFFAVWTCQSRLLKMCVRGCQ